jgi:hypothetical protein
VDIVVGGEAAEIEIHVHNVTNIWMAGRRSAPRVLFQLQKTKRKRKRTKTLHKSLANPEQNRIAAIQRKRIAMNPNKTAANENKKERKYWEYG